MARNAADAARSARPKGENFSVLLRIFHAEVLGTNCTGWKSRTREFNPPVSFIKISILKNFHEIFGISGRAGGNKSCFSFYSSVGGEGAS
jgi:hypothetical protein